MTVLATLLYEAQLRVGVSDSIMVKNIVKIRQSIVRFYCGFFHRDLSTLLPVPVVRLNYKSQKSRVLFEWFQLTNGRAVHQNLLRILKYIDIAKTSRQLFSIRALIVELQLAVRFYSFFAILGRQTEPVRSRGFKGATTTSMQSQLVSYRILTRKETAW